MKYLFIKKENEIGPNLELSYFVTENKEFLFDDLKKVSKNDLNYISIIDNSSSEFIDFVSSKFDYNYEILTDVLRENLTLYKYLKFELTDDKNFKLIDKAD